LSPSSLRKSRRHALPPVLAAVNIPRLRQVPNRDGHRHRHLYQHRSLQPWLSPPSAAARPQPHATTEPRTLIAQSPDPVRAILIWDSSLCRRNHTEEELRGGQGGRARASHRRERRRSAPPPPPWVARVRYHDWSAPGSRSDGSSSRSRTKRPPRRSTLAG
jgi:hypothetical protein